MLQACLNGARTRQDHPRVPLSAEELALDAERVVGAGVTELHVHPRDAKGIETLAPDDIAAAVQAIRAKVPGVPVGLSTREGIRTDRSRGFDALRAWSVLPDYVSVNLSEADAPEIIALMSEKGVAVEAGLATAADARRFVKLATAKQALRVLVEIDFEKDVAGALRLADEIMGILEDSRFGLPILLHGFDETMWPLYHRSLELGVDARLGLEDGVTLPDGSLAADNSDIIRAIGKVA
ncbi:3-keto-5-aminohexanoate cleavage protein [Taklimakanibacter lacteus]|uniref:3-keto-5-aminohexanoate cleavage protein n=1 Tax=Taklimakanibacter lacteus TaxID=2268456 RepID=UPI000E66A69F